VLGYLGMQSGSPMQTWLARGLTAFYFVFFISMPIWSRMGQFKAVPDRVTMHD
jgi:ubiquinol-cytochrome c reductase cytochrome b subunit